MKLYKINEIFYSLQGEGFRIGSANIFCRFAGCNLDCWYCDTEFDYFRELSLADIRKEFAQYDCKNIILTGGEPLQQVDDEFIEYFKSWGFYLCVETNGTIKAPEGLDYICVSPKVKDKQIIHLWKDRKINELRYVLSNKMPLPHPMLSADNYFISPMNNEDSLNDVNVDYCIKLIKENPTWRLSSQIHKVWKIR
jgi:organic radical activating enzyme